MTVRHLELKKQPRHRLRKEVTFISNMYGLLVWFYLFIPFILLLSSVSHSRTHVCSETAHHVILLEDLRKLGSSNFLRSGTNMVTWAVGLIWMINFCLVMERGSWQVCWEEKELLLKGGLARAWSGVCVCMCVSVCFEWSFLFQRDSPCFSHGWCLKGEMKGEWTVWSRKTWCG